MNPLALSCLGLAELPAPPNVQGRRRTAPGSQPQRTGKVADIAERAAERRAAALLDALEGDVAGSLAFEEHTSDRRVEMAARHREAVAVACRLALLAPVVHAPPLHPPTLASQLGERLRELYNARLPARPAAAAPKAPAKGAAPAR